MSFNPHTLEDRAQMLGANQMSHFVAACNFVKLCGLPARGPPHVNVCSGQRIAHGAGDVFTKARHKPLSIGAWNHEHAGFVRQGRQQLCRSQ